MTNITMPEVNAFGQWLNSAKGYEGSISTSHRPDDHGPLTDDFLLDILSIELLDETIISDPTDLWNEYASQ